MWSIYRKEETPAEGSELEYMLAKYPKAGTHNSNNYIFVDVHPTAVNPLVVGTLVDDKGVQLTGDTLAWVMAKELNQSERNRAIHLTKSEASIMHKHPAWRVWCGEYGEDREQFVSDWEYITQMIANAMPEAAGSWPAFSPSMTHELAQTIMKIAITSNA